MTTKIHDEVSALLQGAKRWIRGVQDPAAKDSILYLVRAVELLHTIVVADEIEVCKAVEVGDAAMIEPSDLDLIKIAAKATGCTHYAPEDFDASSMRALYNAGVAAGRLVVARQEVSAAMRIIWGAERKLDQCIGCWSPLNGGGTHTHKPGCPRAAMISCGATLK